MVVALLFVLFLAVVGLLSWRFRDRERGPRSCCSLHTWPPRDLTDDHTAPRP